MKSKQMRISEVHYNGIEQLSKELGISKAEFLGGVISMIKSIIKNNATSVKIVCGGEEKELILTLPIGQE